MTRLIKEEIMPHFSISHNNGNIYVYFTTYINAISVGRIYFRGDSTKSGEGITTTVTQLLTTFLWLLLITY